MLPSFATDTITVEEPVWVEERGKRVKTYPGPGVEIPGCSVQPASASSDLMLRDNVQILFTVFMPNGPVVSRFAKITFAGDQFAIDGVPYGWRSPLGGGDHVVLHLVRWEG